VTVTVTIRDQTGAGRVSNETTIEGVSDRTTLRDLIRTRVRDEVARYNAGPTDLFNGLVMPEGATPAANGYTMPRRRRLDWERQAKLVLDALAHNGFFVLVDGRQVIDLDEELALTADSDVRFIRLVPLVGG
jgi:hypothetical protein